MSWVRTQAPQAMGLPGQPRDSVRSHLWGTVSWRLTVRLPVISLPCKIHCVHSFLSTYL